jgi:hypothetical protein
MKHVSGDGTGFKSGSVDSLSEKRLLGAFSSLVVKMGFLGGLGALGALVVKA